MEFLLSVPALGFKIYAFAFKKVSTSFLTKKKLRHSSLQHHG